MNRRAERVASLVREELSNLLRTEIKDPRLSGMISITEVEVDPDLECAKVFVSSLGGAAEKDEVLKGLSSASGFFRTELAKNLKMRYTPRLEFRWDESIEHGAHILDLLAKVKPPSQTT
jgi:ribosome-binding factor A